MTTYKGKIAGDLILGKNDDASGVTSIGGSLDVSEGATCDLPGVTSIGGSLYVRAGATCDLPGVTSIGGSLYVSEGATCDLPGVTSIGGSLYVRAGATCDLPGVTSIGGSLYIYSIRKDGRRVATAEFVGFPAARAVQVKGVCNALPPKAVRAAADKFAEAARKASR
ncbi:hypothetical protein KNJ79_02170 [Sphingopyxis indica]|uniref:hypothetical protein n=1 Tax=Sphingopyxis indica TaxID=436663 RepID=UPI0029393A1A|nr:hypothetical protein [Sphingopyxis indica]WOF43792.1 hypothetical protein KNJ79_02170 [Sphingopyxis indica]